MTASFGTVQTHQGAISLTDPVPERVKLPHRRHRLPPFGSRLYPIRQEILCKELPRQPMPLRWSNLFRGMLHKSRRAGRLRAPRVLKHQWMLVVHHRPPARQPAGPHRGDTGGGLDFHSLLDGRRRRCCRDDLHPVPDQAGRRAGAAHCCGFRFVLMSRIVFTGRRHGRATPRP